MAGYSIVLNLSGNAVRNANALATALSNANTQATGLRTSLASINATLTGMNATGVGMLATNLDRARRNAAALSRERSLSRIVTPAPITPRNHVPTKGLRNDERYTRHPYTRIASFGYGFNVGGFSGRLSSILQPDANGQLFGMNASTLARGMNITAIAGNVMASIGKALFKVTAVSTLAPVLAGGLGIGMAVRALNSESFAEGVRLISRRHQASLGLGDAYLQASQNTDFLAASYGLDRSTALSSINVLTGLGVGGSGRQLTLNEATGLTKVGGLISQHHGVPFERVMTNIQQLLVQDRPHIRDIRELLNQAPILGKYALREMEQQGLQGVDVRTYLKDQRNIFSVLKQYELDIASNAGMQARGRIALASQDMWANIAGNNPFWGYVGNAGSSIINSWGSGVNSLMTMLVGNQDFKVMVKQIELIFDNLGTKGVTFIDKLIGLIDGLAARYGIDLGDKSTAKFEVDRDETIRATLGRPEIVRQIREAWEQSTLPVSNVAESREKEFQNFLQSTVANSLLNDPDLRNAIRPIGRFDSVENYPWYQRWTGIADSYAKGENIPMYMRAAQTYRSNDERTTYFPRYGSISNPSSAFAAYMLPTNRVLDRVNDIISDTSRIGTIDPAAFKGGTAGASGEDLTGMNRDRRALEIHFHNKLVEWNSTIEASNPQEVLDAVAVDMERLMSAAIQKALLGATNKVGSRWY